MQSKTEPTSKQKAGARKSSGCMYSLPIPKGATRDKPKAMSAMITKRALNDIEKQKHDTR